MCHNELCYTLEMFLETMCHNELCYTLEMFLEPCVIMNCVAL